MLGRLSVSFCPTRFAHVFLMHQILLFNSFDSIPRYNIHNGQPALEAIPHNTVRERRGITTASVVHTNLEDIQRFE